ncbi:MAG: DUF4037 domain-containing protein [Candidatus Latescibacteria bacterium]|nr:DUF4037 domain-containing protein [Candidatus Latescibacterota bacterium]
MQGHQFCKALFDDIFLPVLQERFPDVLPRLSAGVIGSGSDVIGVDDELSRDHDWGPSKCRLLLPEKDLSEHGSAIAQALVAALPDEFLGIDINQLHPKTVNVNTIDAAYRDTCGLTHPPETIPEWGSTNENGLFFAASGFVLYDPSGSLKQRMTAFQNAYYPSDIWKWKIAGALWDIWHNADYNSCRRLAKRGDGVGLLIGQGEFVSEIITLFCLFNKQFPIFWKWKYWQFQRLSKWTDKIDPALRDLEAASDHATRGKIMEAMCQTVREILQEMGLLPDAEWRNFMGSRHILKQIESTEARAWIISEDPSSNVW